MDKDNLNLIAEVKKRQFLWDRRFEKYTSPDSSEVEWSLIGKTIGVSSETAKYIWTDLCSRFYKEMEGADLTKSIIPGTIYITYHGKWAYFWQMLFMTTNIHKNTEDSVKYKYLREPLNAPPDVLGFPHKPFVEKPRPSSPSPAKVTRPDEVPDAKASSSSSSSKNHRSTDSKSSDEERRHKEQKRKASSQPKDDRRKERRVEDDDMMYFKSLLSYIKNIPLSRRLHIRNQFQNILIEELATMQDM